MFLELDDDAGQPSSCCSCRAVGGWRLVLSGAAAVKPTQLRLRSACAIGATRTNWTCSSPLAAPIRPLGLAPRDCARGDACRDRAPTARLIGDHAFAAVEETPYALLDRGVSRYPRTYPDRQSPAGCRRLPALFLESIVDLIEPVSASSCSSAGAPTMEADLTVRETDSDSGTDQGLNADDVCGLPGPAAG